MALTDAQRGPRASWLRRHRLLTYGSGVGGLQKLSAALRARGIDRSPDTIKGWESSDDRSPIPPDVLPALEDLFGEAAPRPLVTATAPELVSALLAQADAISALVVELREAREARDAFDERLRSLELAATLQAPSPAARRRGRSAPLETAGSGR